MPRVLPALTRFFDAGNVEEQAGIVLGRHHVLVVRISVLYWLVAASLPS